MRGNRFLILSFYVLFFVSTVIVLIASTAPSPVPAWGGYIDVGIVVGLAILGILTHQRNKGTPRHELAHMVAIYLFPFLLISMWLFRDSLDFNILLPGLAWRTYLFLSILPHTLTLWNAQT